MLKVVVFDGGWGGQVVANYLAAELGVVEVIAVIDWQHAPYEGKPLTELMLYAVEQLRPWIQEADLVVLGGYIVSLLQDKLQKTYPKQKFVGMGVNVYRILHTRVSPKCVAVLGDELMQHCAFFTHVRQGLPDTTLIFPDCSGWEDLINIGEMSAEVLRFELQDYFQLSSTLPSARLAPTITSRAPRVSISAEMRLRISEFISINTQACYPQIVFRERGPGDDLPLSPSDLYVPDTVLLLNTHYWDIKPEIEEVFGARTRVMDFRKKLLHDVCLALSLYGVDGERSK